MIRSEAEYEEVSRKVQEQSRRLHDTKKQLSKDHTREEVERAIAPIRTLHLQLQEELEHFERMKRGDFGEIQGLDGIGNLLIGARIHRDLTQKELADKLGIHETQVSRDEKNEYHNITLERARRILKVLGVQLRSAVEIGQEEIDADESLPAKSSLPRSKTATV